MDEPIGHTPVLTRVVRELLAVRPGETVVDATLGLGGHARLFADAIGETGTLVGLDADARSIEEARPRLESASCRVELVQANFADLAEVLESLGLNRVDVLFADLGLNSCQLDEAERGFSFQSDGPLDMRMSSDQRETASDLVNRLKERELADLLYYNAQEFASRRIARWICNVRRDGRITTTARLSEVVCRAVGVDPKSRRSKIHPATKTFLALRIAVNRESQCLNALLAAAPALLRPGGRIGVIAFHSGEDKPVKVDFRERKKEGVYEIVTKKPVIADAEERRSNPRSRSAKLRVAIRTEGKI
ncbi:MAG: 16S rRNA (cytosine(1402)-N(4))-methyltransferase RsmH [Planctomycetes bacterium]|nr:16S rRNA (cytosine(1402)-N(4))-methyltransferase RsmH [Planctomycetota bacterium]